MSKVSYYIMSKKGYLVLKALIDHGFKDHIQEVVYAEDKNVLKDYALEIKTLCETNGLRNFRRKEAPNETSEYVVSISWRWLIPITNNQKVIVLHDSLLPKYRGFAPLVSAMINGEKELGVTALFASKEYDRGAIIKQDKIATKYPLKIKDAIDQISNCYVNLVLYIMEKIVQNHPLKTIEQQEAKASYSLWRDDEDYRVDWNKNALYLERFINATGYPYKGAYGFMGKEAIRIREAIAIEDVIIENRTPGKVIFMENGIPIVVCGTGLLRITSAYYDATNEAVLPLNKFRIRFT